MTPHSLAIVTFTISVIICEIIQYELSKYCRPVFYLELEGQVPEKQRRRLYLACQIYSPAIRRRHASSNFHRFEGPPTSWTVLQFICNYALKIATFFIFFIIKISIRVKYFESQNNKSKQWSPNRKMSHCTFQSDVRYEHEPLAEKEQDRTQNKTLL